MKKLSYLFFVAVAVIATSCNQSELLGQELPVPVPMHQTNVVITGDSMITTRAANGRVEFAGGYATGAGLYSEDARAQVEAVPYSGYQLVSFAGGPVGGNTNQFNGLNRYDFKIDSQDWRFSVSFKKECTISVVAGSGGTVSGGGVILEGESCTVSATPNSGYKFDGWYDGASKVSSSASYTFTVSSSRTCRSYLIENIIFHNVYMSDLIMLLS